MKLSIICMCALALALLSPAATGDWKPVRETTVLTYLLGSKERTALYAEITLKGADPAGVYGVSIVFTARQGSKVISRVSRDLGQSFAPNIVEVSRFTGSSRDQVFVSLEMGAVRSWMFDFDGTTLRIPYQLDAGHARAYPSFDRDGKCQIAEEWPLRVYEQRFGKYEGAASKQNIAVRIVRLPTRTTS